MRRYLLVLITFAMLLTTRAHAVIVSDITTGNNDSAQVTIITIKGDTLQGIIQKTTKNAYVFNVDSKRKRIHRSKIQKIIYPDGHVSPVHQEYKDIVLKRTNILFVLISISLALFLIKFLVLPVIVANFFYQLLIMPYAISTTKLALFRYKMKNWKVIFNSVWTLLAFIALILTIILIISLIINPPTISIDLDIQFTLNP